MIKKISYLLLVVFLYGCKNESNKSNSSSSINEKENWEGKFDFGEYGDGFYYNEMFNLKINYDTTWNLQSREELINIAGLGEKLIVGDDPKMKIIIEAGKINVAYLFGMFKHEIGAAVDFNPSMLVLAENTKNAPGVKTGKDYLFHTKRLLKMSNLNADIKMDIGEKKIGSKTFATMQSEMMQLGVKIIQEYFFIVENKFALGFILSYNDESQRNELFEMMEKVEI